MSIFGTMSHVHISKRFQPWSIVGYENKTDIDSFKAKYCLAGVSVLQLSEVFTYQ